MTSRNSRQAFTLLELLAIVAICAVLLALLLPTLARSPRRNARIKCVNNLKNVGLAFRIFSTDNNDLFPFQIAQTNGGLKGSIQNADAFKHFLVLSNELSTPMILKCPDDRARTLTTNWTNFSNANLSYFVGLTASETWPQSILSGDRNLTVNGKQAPPGLLQIDTNSVFGFSQTIHTNCGNICFGDGSVQQLSSAQLDAALKVLGGTTNRFLLP